MRLQVALARAGVASRRKSEELIVEGRVTVNGETITQLGSKVGPDDHIKVDGKLLQRQPREPVYILFNKPRETITAVTDDRGRRVVMDFLKEVKERVFPVGRLDWDTEGVLLITNDGDLANKLTHPSYEVPRTYRAKVRGVPDAKTLEKMRTGVYLDDGRTEPADVKVVERTEANSWLEITVREGRNRLVRRLCQAVGHPINKLRRTRYANLKTTGLRPGQWRYLTSQEVERLRRTVK